MSNISEGTTGGLHTPVVHTGTPSSDIQEDWVTTDVYFPGFANLQTARGEKVMSPDFYCLGYEWSVWIYPRGENPRGENTEGEDKGAISIHLVLRSSPNVSIAIEYGFSINKSSTSYIARTFTSGNGFGFPNFLKRETALTYLTRGVLMIKVRMRPVPTITAPFIPGNSSIDITVKDFFMDKASADIVFEVGGGQEVKKGCKGEKIKIPATKFYAHRLILKKAAPQLAKLTLAGGSPSLVEISETSPETFKTLLLYIYGFRIPDLGKDDLRTKEIIKTADKFGVTNLKLEAEASLVSSITFTVENVLDHLQFAESMNCAYLKEQAMDFIVNNTSVILNKKMLTDDAAFPSGSDMLIAMARKQAAGQNANDFSTMSINELRHKAYAKKLEVDGTREMLISALESSENNV